jgi:molecular chaperone HscB
VPPELLEEVFELNMALDELRTGDDSVLPQLRAAREHFLGLRGEIDAEMEREFIAHDAAGVEEREAVLARLRALLNRRRYVRNLITEVDKEMASR